MGEKQLPNKEVTSFIAMAHELKAPLAVIRQLVIARDQYSSQETENALRRIELLTERMLRLTQTLSYSHSIAEFETETINLNHLCEAVLHEFTPLCRELGREIEFHPSRQQLLVCSNREVLHSMLVGLCDNAIHYSEDNANIVVHARRVKDTMRVGVQDNGTHIQAAQLKQMRHAPHQFAVRPARSGLGIYIAEQFAKALKANLHIMRPRSGGLNIYLDVPQSKQLHLFTV